MVEVLRRAEAPTRKAIMDAARSICDIEVLGLVPGAKACVSGEEDPFYIESMQVVRFTKGGWEPVGEVITTYEGKTPRELQ